jgi:energy-coupling factor transporter ATP-binding protein EcfA2
MLPIDEVFPRMATVFPGFVRDEYVLLTGNSGSGKSRFARYLFVRHPINMHTKYKLPVHILYNSTEESITKIESTFVQAYLIKKYGINLNFYQINHYAKQALNESTMDKIREAYSFVEEKIKPFVTITNIKNPFGIYDKARSMLAGIGKLYLDGQQVPVGSRFDTYIPNDPNMMFILLNDNVNNLSKEKSMTHEETLRNFSETYCRNLLNLRFGAMVVNVQQQVGDKEKVEANYSTNNMAEKLYPSLSTTAHCTHLQRDCTIGLGIFKPYKHHRIIPKYAGHEVSKIPTITGIHILKTREAEPTTANIVPMNHQNGDIFKELPKIQERNLFSTK